LAQIGNALRKKGARETDQTPKVVRALGGAAVAPPDIAPVEDVRPSDPAKDALRKALVANVGRLITNDPLTRTGNTEGLHQMRVACRRTRSDLKTFAPLVDDEWAAEITRELSWIANVLGKVRDLDVMIERLQQSSKDLDGAIGRLFEALQEEEGSAREAAAAALGSKRYLDLLDRLVAATMAPPTTEEAERPCEDVLIPLVAARWRKLAAAARSTGQDAPDEVLHDIRIKAKKVRYAAEAVAPSMGKKRKKELLSFAEKVAVLQDVLGAHQDATVAMSTIKDATKKGTNDPDFVFAAGRLYEREASAAKTSRKDSKTTWEKVDRKKNLGWLTT
jgi:CHAD domain-containing protein